MTPKRGRPVGLAKQSTLNKDEALLRTALQSNYFLACKTREDLEVAARGKFTDAFWERMSTKANNKNMTIGEHLQDCLRQARQKAVDGLVDSMLDPILKFPDGSPRPEDDAMRRLESWIDLEKERLEFIERKKAHERLELAKHQVSN